MKRCTSRRQARRAQAAVTLSALLVLAGCITYGLVPEPAGAAGLETQLSTPTTTRGGIRAARRRPSALAARAPYFHNGIAESLEAVVCHYETHLGFVFTGEERADLVAFLNAL